MNETIKHPPNDIKIIKVPKDEAAKLIKHYAIYYRRDITGNRGISIKTIQECFSNRRKVIFLSSVLIYLIRYLLEQGTCFGVPTGITELKHDY